MAGKRQHYIPQLLLRGFVSRDADGGSYTWQFRKGREPFECNLINVAVIKHFYGDSRLEPLDDLITASESKWAAVLARTKAARAIASDDRATFIDFVSFMLARTNFVRGGMAEALASMMAAATEHYSFPDKIDVLLQTALAKAESELTADFVQRFGPAAGPIMQDQMARVRGQVRTDAAALTPPAIMQSLGWLFDEVNLKVPDAHNKALASHFDPHEISERTRHFEALHWDVVSLGEGRLILGDVVAVGFDSANGELYPAAMDALRGGAILLPLTEHLVVVGSPAKDPALPGLEKLNQASAEMSREFFVATASGHAENQMHELIGSRSRLMSDSDIRKLMSKALDEESPPLG